MNIKDFLVQIAEARSFQEKTFVFTGKGAYPWLFFSHILPRLSVQLGFSSVSYIDPEGIGSCADLERLLYLSFLGTNYFFWIGDIARFGKTIESDLTVLLADYQGPHTIGYYFDASQKGERKDSSMRLYVDCSEPLLFDDFSLLVRIFYPEMLESFQIRKDVDGVLPNVISLETALLYLNYLAAGGSFGRGAFSKWSERLIAPDHSLFKLAQFFFSKDRSRFLSLWHAVRDDYPPEFWIAYWSEQLWQAHLFVSVALRGDLVLAKKGVNRLPFSFMQRDWKNYRLREFAVAHSILYGVDLALKNGAGTSGLDLFVLRFLTGSFARV